MCDGRLTGGAGWRREVEERRALTPKTARRTAPAAEGNRGDGRGWGSAPGHEGKGGSVGPQRARGVGSDAGEEREGGGVRARVGRVVVRSQGRAPGAWVAAHR